MGFSFTAAATTAAHAHSNLASDGGQLNDTATMAEGELLGDRLIGGY